MSRELIKNIHNSFCKLRERAERIAERSKGNASDLLMFGRELRYFFLLLHERNSIGLENYFHIPYFPDSKLFS